MKVRDGDRRLFLGGAGGLIGLAWVVLWLWGQSPYGRFLRHEDLALVRLNDGGRLLLFAAGWTVMIAAMMLPTSLPLVVAFRTLVRYGGTRPGCWPCCRPAIWGSGASLACWSMWAIGVCTGPWRAVPGWWAISGCWRPAPCCWPACISLRR